MHAKKSKLAQAIGLARESREHYKAGIRCKGYQSGRDRIKLSQDLSMKVRWVLGRLTNEQYGAYLSGNY